MITDLFRSVAVYIGLKWGDRISPFSSRNLVHNNATSRLIIIRLLLFWMHLLSILKNLLSTGRKSTLLCVNKLPLKQTTIINQTLVLPSSSSLLFIRHLPAVLAAPPKDNYVHCILSTYIQKLHRMLSYKKRKGKNEIKIVPWFTSGQDGIWFLFFFFLYIQRRLGRILYNSFFLSAMRTFSCVTLNRIFFSSKKMR